MHHFDWLSSTGATLGGYLPAILGAIAILIIGWIVALVCRSLTRKALAALHVNERMASQVRPALNLERILASVVFWVVFLFALIATFNVLSINSVSGPLANLASAVLLYLPRILLAAALGLIAWLLATVGRNVVNRSLASTRLDDKLSEGEADTPPVSKTLGQVVYWLIILVFLPAIVGALHIQGLMAPLSDMITKLLAILPNIIAAVLIGGIGWLIANVVRNLVSSILSATSIDRFTRSEDGEQGIKLSQLCGTLAFILVIVPSLIAALDALQIEVIARPARDMLQLFLVAIPNILAAAAILFIAWYIGRFAASLLSQLLAQLGVDRIPRYLGLDFDGSESPIAQAGTTPSTTTAPRVSTSGNIALSTLIGRVALFFIMLFATVEAANRMGFGSVRGLVDQLIAFAASVLFGLVILAVGQWLANLAAAAIRRASSDHSLALSRIARIAILGLVVAMGLHAMGFADSIVNLAFGLILGAVAIAIALAFGLGGREAAARVTRSWADRYLGNKDNQ